MGETEYLLVIILFNIFLLAFLIAAILFVVQYRSKKKENLAVLQKQEILHQQQLLSSQIDMQIQTMQHIGREIHDNVGQKLTLASLYTQQLAFENKALNINHKIENIGEIIDQSLSELRLLSKSLTNQRVDSHSIASLLKQEFAKIEALKKYKTNLSIHVNGYALPYQMKSVILGVVQEFSQNSIKHSDCQMITANLTKTNTQLVLTIADDGNGFDPREDKGTGIGLNNMRSRVESLGGHYEMQSNKHIGTTLCVKFDTL